MAHLTEHRSALRFSWKNEFRQWIGDLEPQIHVYLFSADDVAKHDRATFLRRVSISHSSQGLIAILLLSGTTTEGF
jgi:hypothetical protein